MTACAQPGCGGKIEDGFCDACGMAPAAGTTGLGEDRRGFDEDGRFVEDRRRLGAHRIGQGADDPKREERAGALDRRARARREAAAPARRASAAGHSRGRRSRRWTRSRQSSKASSRSGSASARRATRR